MTLIEVMVALALLSLLSIGVLASFRYGEHGYRQLTRIVSSQRDLLTAQRFLRQVIESAHPAQFDGARMSLTLTGPMPRGVGASGDYRYELLMGSDARGGKTLLVRWSLDRRRSEPHEETLLEDIEGLNWAYLPQEPDSGGALLDEPRWLSSWTENRKPPALVRLKVTFPPGDPRHWPELRVAPRNTDEADCQFDVVSQACREI